MTSEQILAAARIPGLPLATLLVFIVGLSCFPLLAAVVAGGFAMGALTGVAHTWLTYHSSDKEGCDD